tara:strand:+ start:103 stop:687 length:585 start_codon:yes stop_codon:yes gene_type:complete
MYKTREGGSRDITVNENIVNENIFSEQDEQLGIEYEKLNLRGAKPPGGFPVAHQQVVGHPLGDIGSKDSLHKNAENLHTEKVAGQHVSTVPKVPPHGGVRTDLEAADALRDTLEDLKDVCDRCSKDIHICSPGCQEMRPYCEYLGYENAPYVPCTASNKHFADMSSPIGYNFDTKIDGVLYSIDRPRESHITQL